MQNKKYRRIGGICLILWGLVGCYPLLFRLLSISSGSLRGFHYFFRHLPNFAYPAGIAVGIALLCPVPDLVPGIGFAALAVLRLLPSEAFLYGYDWTVIFSALGFLLLAEALLLKKLPAKKLAAGVALLIALSVVCRLWKDYSLLRDLSSQHVGTWDVQDMFEADWQVQFTIFPCLNFITYLFFVLSGCFCAAGVAKREGEKINFAGIAGLVLACIGRLIIFITKANVYESFGVISLVIISLGFLLLPLLCLRNRPKRVRAAARHRQQTAAGTAAGTAVEIDTGDGYISLATHVLLLLFTCGIWQYVWVYKTTAYLNRAPGAEPYDPTKKLLLCIFVPFYMIYWLYRHGQRIDMLRRAKGVLGSDIASLCLILGIFFPLIGVIIMQMHINDLSLAK